MTRLPALRSAISAARHIDEDAQLARLQQAHAPSAAQRAAAHDRACALVRDIRGADTPGLMEVFLSEYGLSTKEGADHFGLLWVPKEWIAAQRKKQG